jgi:hypothetical protein
MHMVDVVMNVFLLKPNEFLRRLTHVDPPYGVAVLGERATQFGHCPLTSKFAVAFKPDTAQHEQVLPDVSRSNGRVI